MHGLEKDLQGENLGTAGSAEKWPLIVVCVNLIKFCFNDYSSAYSAIENALFCCHADFLKHMNFN